MARWQPVVTAVSTCATLLFATGVGYAAQRTFVSSAGLDTNSCAISASCRSFAAAMAQTDLGGEIVVLDSAGYGPVTITKSVSIIAPRGIYAGITVPAGQIGMDINSGSARVLLRGLTINGQGGDDGVRVVSATIVQIEDCVVSNNGNDATERNGIGVSAGGATANIAIRDSVIAENVGEGIALASASAAEVLKVDVSGTLIGRNGGHGVSASAASANAINLTLAASTIANNGGSGVDVTAATSQTIILTGNSITHNAKGLGADILSDASNVVDSNTNPDTGSVGAVIVR